MIKKTLILVLIAIGVNPLLSQDEPEQGLIKNQTTRPYLGKKITIEEAQQWNLSVFTDGQGLPKGAGDAIVGKQVYQQYCLSCHGENGLGLSADQLAGAEMSLTSDYPEKTIGAYWPYATTLFDMIRRSMPMNKPNSLNPDQVYAVVAYLLYLNNIIDEQTILNATTLPKIKMPNAEGFINLNQQ